MADLAAIIAPVFALVLLGAAARQRRLLRPAGLRAINDFAFFLALPCLLFSSVAEAELLRGFGVSALFFTGALTVFALGIGLARLALGAGLAQATVIGLNACYGNTVQIGIPVIAAAYGPDGIAAMLPIVALHSVLLLPLATLLIEADGKGADPVRILRGTLRAVGRNPIILSIVLGFAWRLLGLPVPLVLHRLLAALGACGPTLALFCLGASLPGMAVRGAAAEAALGTALKLLLLPALVWLLCRLAGVAPLPAAVAVLTAGMPTGANAFLLARRAETLAEASAGSVALGTVLSVLTLSALLAWLR